MEFDCPECGAPHAFPADQIPDDGITVACTSCGAHITLDQDGVKGGQSLSGGPPAAAPEPEPPPAPAPRAPAPPPRGPAPGGWPKPAGGSESELESTRQSMEAQKPSGGWPSAAPSNPPPSPQAPPPSLSKPPPTPAPGVDDEVEALTKADKEVVGDDVFGRVGRKVSAAAASAAARVGGALDDAADEEMEGETDVPEGLAFPGFAPDRAGRWTWRDLPRAFVGVFDVRRVLFTTAGFWAALVVFALLQWVGGWLGAKVFGMLATVFSVVAWAALVGVAAIAAAVMGYVTHQTVVEQRPSSINAGVTWAKTWVQSVVGTPLAFAVVAAGGWLAQVLVAYLGKIPFAGPIVWGVLSPVSLALGLASGAVILAMIYSLPLYVPVIYNEKTTPVDTLKRMASLYRTHGFSLVGYVLLTLVMIGIAMAVTVWPMLVIGRLVSSNAAGMMGANYVGLLTEIPASFRGFAAAQLPLPTSFAGAGDTGFGHTLGGIFAGIGAAFPIAFVLALMALTYYTAGGIIYAIVTGRKKG